MKNEHASSTAPLLLGMAAGAALGAAGVMATNTSQLDEILRDVGLLRIVVAAHINGVLCPGSIHHGKLQRLVGKPVGDIQHLLHAVKEGVPGMADAQQQDLSTDRPQTVVAATGGAGGVVFQFPGQICCCAPAAGRNAVCRMKRTHHPDT